MFLKIVFLQLIATFSMALSEKEPMPAFSLPELSGTKKVTLASLKGKVVVIDFWASWCEPCKVELPALSKLLAKYKSKKLEVIAINLDDDKKNATAFITENKVKVTFLYDLKRAFADKCGLVAMPTSFILDKKGVIRFIHSGFNDGDIEKFEKEIKTLL